MLKNSIQDLTRRKGKPPISRHCPKGCRSSQPQVLQDLRKTAVWASLSLHLDALNSGVSLRLSWLCERPGLNEAWELFPCWQEGLTLVWRAGRGRWAGETGELGRRAGHGPYCSALFPPPPTHTVAGKQACTACTQGLIYGGGSSSTASCFGVFSSFLFGSAGDGT